jgi:hypothetical protein
MTKFNETLYWVAELSDGTTVSEKDSKFFDINQEKLDNFKLISSQNDKSFNFEIGSKRKLIFARRNRISSGDRDMIIICGWYEGLKMRVLFIFSDGNYVVKEEWEDNAIYSKVS